MVRQALGHGHEVVALARSIDTLDIEHERLTKVRGDVMTAEGLDEAIRGSQAVLIAIGSPPGTRRERVLRRCAQRDRDDA